MSNSAKTQLVSTSVSTCVVAVELNEQAERRSSGVLWQRVRTRSEQRLFNRSLRMAVRGYLAKSKALGVAVGAGMTMVALFAATPASAQYAAGGSTVSAAAGSIEIGAGAAASKAVVAAGATNSVAIGNLATVASSFVYVAGTGSVAIGSTATSTNDQQGVAIGAGASVTGKIISAGIIESGNIAIGGGASAISTGIDTVNYSSQVAIGLFARTTVDGAIAMGEGAAGTGFYAASLGAYSAATGAGSVAAGGGSQAAAIGAIAIGGATGITGGALSGFANATGVSSIAMGTSSVAGAADAIAIGGQSSVAAAATSGIAIGKGATASVGANAAAFGVSAVASAADATAIGSNATASGANSIAIGGDAKAANAANASGTKSTALGYNATSAGVTSIAAGSNASSAGASSVAVGNASNATNSYSIAIGESASATNDNAVAIGRGTVSSGLNGVAIGLLSSQNGGGTAVGNDSHSSGSVSTAVGYRDNALADFSTAIGTSNTANGKNSIALGVNTVAGVAGSATTIVSDIAIGNAAKATGGSSVALGDAAIASSSGAVAIGQGATAQNGKAVAIGVGNVADGDGAVSIGDPNVATGAGAVALGKDNTATGIGAVALGNTNTAVGQGSVAIGRTSAANNAGSVALGDTANVSVAASKGVALGSGASVTAAGGVALGQGSLASRGAITAIADPVSTSGATVTTTTGAIAIGGRQIINVAAGTQATDAVNVGQITPIVANLGNLGATTAAALGGTATYNPATGKISSPAYTISGTTYTDVGSALAALGAASGSTKYFHANSTLADSSATGTDSVAVGPLAIASGTNAVAQGKSANASGGSATALGVGTTASATNSTAVGDGATAAGINSVALGALANAGINGNGIAIGGSASASGGSATALGANSKATNTFSMAMGDAAQSTAVNAIALGRNAVASNADSVALGANSTTSAVHVGAYTVNGGTAAATAPTSVVSVGGVGSERQIQNVASGVVSATSTDAVNGSQLFIVGTAVNAVGTTVAANLGGGAVYDPLTGKVSAPAYAVGSGSFNNVGSALAALQTSSPIQYSTAGAPTTANGLVPSQNVTLVGGAAGPVTLDNVAPGSTVAGSTQAINGGQLNTGLASVATNIGGGSTFDPVTGKVTAPSITVAGKAYTDVTSAIQAAGGGLNVTTAKSGSGIANGTSVTNVAPGGTATITAGNNIITTQTGSTIAVAVNPALTGLTSVSVTGGPTLDATGIKLSSGNTLDMGGNVITNLAAGSTAAGSTQAINGGQLNTGLASVATDLGGGAKYDPVTGKVTAPSYNIAGSTYTDVGSALGALAAGGAKTKYFNSNSVLADSQAIGTNAVAVGPNAQAAGNNAIASGPNAQAAGNLASAYGSGANAVGTNSTALGANSSANNTGDVALGANSTTTAPNKGAYSVNGGTAAATAPTSVVSVGGVGSERQIQNVASGVVSATSTDAVNGSQLFIVGTAVNTVGTTVAANLGGGSTYDPLTGKVSAPSYNVGGTAMTNVGAAIAALQSGSPVQYSTASAPTTANGLNPSNNMTLVGKVAGGVVLDNVAPGSTLAGSTQAINGGQLNLGLASVATNIGGGSTFDPVTGKVTAPSITVAGKAYTDVSSAIQAAGGGLNVTTAKSGSGIANGTSVTNVAPGGTATITAGNNIITTQTGSTIAVAVNPALTGLTSVSVTGGPTLDATGIKLSSGNTLDMGGNVITNLTAGSTAAGSTQAINGGQLNTIGSSVATNLGGGSTFDPVTGTVTAPSYTVGSSKLADVGAAIAALQTGAPVQYSTAGAPTTANGLVPSNNMTLVGAAAGPVVLDNVAAGSMVAGSTQAINGGQLNTGLTSVATNLGGGSAFDPVTGKVTAPSYTIGATTFNNVGSALGAVNTAVTSLTNGTLGLVQQVGGSPGTGQIVVGSSTGGTSVSFTGTGGDRTLTGVAAGTIAAASTDAVNGSQIAANQASVAAALGGGSKVNPNGTISAPSYTVGSNTVADVGAAIAALQTGSPVQYSTAGAPTTANGLVPSNNMTLVGAAAGPVVLDNVAPGSTVAGSTQAINGGQLNTGLASVAANLGGGSTFDPVTGTVTAPSYTIGGTTYNNVGGALGAVSTAVNGGGIKYFHTTSTLADSAPVGANSIAIGPVAGTGASGAASIAMGLNATSTAADSIAIGTGASAASVGGVAIGQGTSVAGGAGVAIGAGNTSYGQGAVTIGDPSYASGTGAFTGGANNIANADGTASATAANQANGAVAIGNANTAIGQGSVAIGNASKAGAAGAIALGDTALATNAGDVALGSGAVTAAPNTGAFTLNGGTASAVAPTSVVSFGAKGAERQLQNVAAGVISATSTDAVNGSQLFTVGTAVNNLGAGTVAALGGGAKVAADGTVTAPSYVIGGNTYGDVGSALAAQGKLAVQYTSDALGNPTAVVDLAASKALPVGTTGVALNGLANATTASGAVALGQMPMQYATSGAPTTANPAVPSNNVTLVGAAAGPVVLDNVAPGSTVAGSTQAINGGQLNTGLASVATNLGGGSAFNPITGTVTAPSYTIGATAFNNVGSALGAVNTSLTNLTNGTAGLVQQVGGAPGSGALTIGAATGGTSVNVAGTSGDRTVTGVAAGTIAATSTDAVNGSQIAANQASVAAALGGGSKVNPNGTVSAPSYTVGSNTVGDVGAAIVALQTGAPVQYSTAGAPTTANGLVPSNNMTLVGAAAGPVVLDNVAPGSTVAGSTQAINGGQLNTSLASVAANLGGGSAYDPVTGTVTAPSYTIGATAYNNVGSALGALDASVNGGAGIKYFRTNSTLADAAATGTDSTAVGPLASASGTNAIAMGNGANAAGTGGIAIGNSAAAKALGAMALGDTATATGVNSVALGAGSTDGGQANVVSIGAVGAERKLINVAPGTIAAGSTDAVNGGQIFANQASVASALGGGSKVNPDGTVSAPSYAVGGTTYNNVGGAVTALDTAVTGLQGQVASMPIQGNNTSKLAAPSATGVDATAVGFGSTATGANSVALGAGSTDGGQANVVSVGAVGAERKLINVAPGAITAASTDAVNGSQLFQTNQQMAALDHRSVQYATTPSGSTTSEINLQSDAGGPVVIHNLAPGVAATDAANVAQVQAVAAVANNSVQYDKNPDGSRANAITFSGGAAGAPVSLQNVAAGVNATDAVNLSQLQSTAATTLASANAYTDKKVSNLAAFAEQGIKDAKQLAISGTALALAASGLRYDDRPGKTSIAGATSFYKGTTGMAFGIGHTSGNSGWRYNLSVNGTPTANKPEFGVVVGASFTFN
jgi:trimeric autotransporter adhesin